MAFNITLQNDGVDATIDVSEQLNLNLTVQVFSGFVAAGGKQQIACQGTDPKNFTWLHHGSGLGGGPKALGEGEVLTAS